MRKYLNTLLQITIAYIVSNVVYFTVRALSLDRYAIVIFFFMVTYLGIYLVFTNIYKNINTQILRSLNDIETILEFDDKTQTPVSKNYRAEKNKLSKLLQELILLTTQAHDHIEDLEKLTDAKSKTLQTVTNVSHQYLDHDHVSDYYHLILASAIQVIETATKGSILVLDDASGRYKYQTCVGYDFNLLKQVDYSLDQTFIQDYHQETATIVTGIQNYDNSKLTDKQCEILDSAGGFDISDVLSAPIIIDGEIHAILNIDSDQTNAFDNIDLQLIQFFTAQISLALKNKLQLDETVKMSKYDQLTGVYNRNYFENYILKRYDNLNTNEFCTIVLCDLNDLKFVNDTYGHTAGDEILKSFAKLISDEIRSTDSIARVGGDEFIILFNNTNYDQAEHRMKQLYDMAKSSPLEFNGDTLPLSFSYGIAESPGDSLVYPILHKIADQRMYAFKSAYKNR